MNSQASCLRTVFCLKTGDKYGDEYVTRLKSMVDRNLDGHRFVCFTDQPVEGIECLPPPSGYAGWWGKVGFFRDDLPIEYPALYLDLDVLVVGDLPDLCSEKMTIIRQTKNIKSTKTVPRYNSSCIYFPKPPPVRVWRWFSSEMMGEFRGDQDWIGYLLPDLNTWPDHYFAYMEHCSDGPPDGCRVVICNMIENHHAAKQLEWVRDVWQ